MTVYSRRCLRILQRRIIWLVLLLAVPFSAANASITLGTWNNTNLNASGDMANVETGITGDSSWFSLQWFPGVHNLLTPRGIDTAFYNSSTPVLEVWTGSIDTGTNVTSQWTTNYGGVTGGGGFGDFLSEKSLDGGTLDAVTEPLYFVLDGITSFPTNANGASFDVHVRYTQNCSGWVSNGRTNSTDTGTCGVETAPEPPILALFGIGLAGLGFSRRRKCA